MFREEKRIAATLADLLPALERGSRTAEVILVDDGSDDATVRMVTPFLRDEPAGRLWSVRLIRHEANRGKGAAVRTGFAAASGLWRLIMDADNSTRITQADKLFDAARRTGSGLVAGSRAAAGAVVTTRPHRRLTGLLFRAALSLMGMRLLEDTQCGFKLYRADAADLVARLGREDRFAFDLEHLMLLRRVGIEEVGVDWTHADHGTVRPVRDGLRMLRSAWRLRRIGPPDDDTDPVRARLALAAIELKPLEPAVHASRAQAASHH